MYKHAPMPGQGIVYPPPEVVKVLGYSDGFLHFETYATVSEEFDLEDSDIEEDEDGNEYLTDSFVERLEETSVLEKAEGSVNRDMLASVLTPPHSELEFMKAQEASFLLRQRLNQMRSE